MWRFSMWLFGIVERTKSTDRTSETRQIASALAGYFGTYRESINMTADPVKMGNWVLDIIDDVPGQEVQLLRMIANNAITQNSWPPDHESGTEAFQQVAAGIGSVCRYISEHGLPTAAQVK